MPADSFQVSLLNTIPPQPDWYKPEISRTRDTIDLWLMPGLPDTIYVRITEGDSLTDTTRFYLSQILRTVRQKKVEENYMTFTTSTRAGALDLNKQLIFYFPDPVMTIDTSRILLKSESDSISPSIEFTDSIQRKAIVKYSFKAGEACKVILDDSAFSDFSGRVNDSTIVGFRVRKLEDYGILMVKINTPPGDGHYIIQLLDMKEKVLGEQFIDQTTTVKFAYLMPGKYKLKAVHDMNRNGMWDPGRYEIKLLPEKVLYYPDEIEIRANWDLQEDWDLAIE
jgi:hypothetical protein